jgi:hypothetical protein
MVRVRFRIKCRDSRGTMRVRDRDMLRVRFRIKCRDSRDTMRVRDKDMVRVKCREKCRVSSRVRDTIKFCLAEGGAALSHPQQRTY